MDIVKKVHQLSEYLTEEAIANALKIPVETVKDILEGKADVAQVETNEENGAPIIQINAVKTAQRQRIISVCRAKGGVGCSVIALGLAYLISKEMSVLLIDLNFAEGGGDQTYYLNLPAYQHIGLYDGDLENCVVEVMDNFYVLQAPRNIGAEKEKVGEIINVARQDFDHLVIDLPFRNEDEFVNEALRQSNTIVAVTSGMDLELVRLGALLTSYRRKEIIVVANCCELPSGTEEIFEGREIININYDGSLDKVFKKCELPREKSIFMQGVTKISDVLLERQRKGILKKLLGGL